MNAQWCKFNRCRNLDCEINWPIQRRPFARWHIYRDLTEVMLVILERLNHCDRPLEKKGPALQASRNFWGRCSRAFSPGCNMTGFQP